MNRRSFISNTTLKSILLTSGFPVVVQSCSKSKNKSFSVSNSLHKKGNSIMPIWKCALELNSDRKITSGSEKALADASVSRPNH